MNSSDNKPIIKLSDILLKLNAYEFNLVAMLIGYIIAEGQPALAQSSLGNFFESVGQVLETIGAQNQYLNKNSTSQIANDLKKLSKKIDNIEIIIQKFSKL